jgi:hypothetical protein
VRVVLTLGLLVLLAAPAAAEGPATARLVYARGPGAERCPAEAELVAAVAAELGRDPFTPDAVTTVRCSVARAGRVLEARIEVLGADGNAVGERALSSPDLSCAELSGAVVLAVAIAVDPMYLAPATLPTTAPATIPATQPTDPVEPPPDPDLTARVPRPPPRRAVELALGVGAALGALPGVAFGVEVEGDLTVGPWAFGLAAHADLGTGVDVASLTDTGSVNAWDLLLAAAACYRERRLGICVRVAGGPTFASSSGFADNRSATQLAAATGIRLSWNLGPLRIHADGMAQLVRASFLVDGAEAWRTSWVTGSVGVAYVRSF